MKTNENEEDSTLSTYYLSEYFKVKEMFKKKVKEMHASN